MKNVLAPKNNWAFTATLLAVVGLNASFTPQQLPVSPIRSIAAEGEAKATEPQPNQRMLKIPLMMPVKKMKMIKSSI